jgi:hypothetical protein
MLDIRISGAKGLDFALVNIEADNLVTNLAISKHQRQADITEADNPDHCAFAIKLFE